MKINITDRSNILIFLVSFFIFCLVAYAASLPFAIYAPLDSFLLKTLESVLAVIFIVINVGPNPINNTSSIITEDQVPDIIKTTVNNTEGLHVQTVTPVPGN